MITGRKDVVGYEVISYTQCLLEDSDYWKVTQRLTQRRSINGTDWEEKQLEMSAKDKSLDRANSMAVMSVMIYLESVNGDLFGDAEVEDELDVILDEAPSLRPGELLQ